MTVRGDRAICHLSEHDDAKETVGFVDEPGRRAALVPGDVSEPQH
ncbi:MAG: hypothetical protein ACRDV8_01185 [Acidimicrobiales bacterium]